MHLITVCKDATNMGSDEHGCQQNGVLQDPPGPRHCPMYR